MRKYEGLIILNTKGKEASVDEMISAISAELKEEGAKIEDTQNLGRRQFAYESKHLEAGQYVSITFQAEPTAVAAIQARLCLSDCVHAQHYQRIS